MNFDWTDQEQTLRDALEAQLDAASRADLAALEAAPTEVVVETLIAQLRRLGKAGYLTLGVGAAGRADTMRLLAAQEAVATASAPLFLAAEASARLCGGLVADHGDPALRETFLAPMGRGECVGAVARAEAPEGAPTTAHLAGDDVVVSGAKAYVTNGPFADVIAVTVDLDGQPAVVLVPGDAPGLTRGPRIETLGLKGLAVCPITLESVRVPRSHLLGPFASPDPLAALQRTEDLVLATCATGIARRSFEAAKDHAADHQRGGKPVMGYQAVRFRLAELLTLVQTAELTCRRAAWLVTDAKGPDAWDADTVVRCAKVFAAEAADRVAAAALQILAGEGFVAGNPVEQAFRDAQYPALAGTSSTVCRMEIADAMLDRYQP